MIDHGFQITHVAPVPDPRGNPERVIALRVDRTLFGVDSPPSAFGLNAAVSHIHTWVIGAGAVAMRHLVESVAYCFGTDL